MKRVKGLSLTSALLASMLALSGAAMADTTVAPDKGVDAGVEGHNVPPQKPEEQTEAADINAGGNDSATTNNELAKDDGVDAYEDRPSDTGAQDTDKQTHYTDDSMVKDKGVDAKDDRIGDDTP